MTLDQIKNATKAQTPNQRLNVLAVAVEKVDGSWAQQSDIKTLDTCSTRSSPALRCLNLKPNVIINTGPIGTGDFQNDPKVIYVMQNLAAQQVGGITLRYWVTTQKTQTKSSKAMPQWSPRLLRNGKKTQTRK